LYFDIGSVKIFKNKKSFIGDKKNPITTILFCFLFDIKVVIVINFFQVKLISDTNSFFKKKEPKRKPSSNIVAYSMLVRNTKKRQFSVFTESKYKNDLETDEPHQKRRRTLSNGFVHHDAKDLNGYAIAKTNTRIETYEKLNSNRIKNDESSIYYQKLPKDCWLMIFRWMDDENEKKESCGGGGGGGGGGDNYGDEEFVPNLSVLCSISTVSRYFQDFPKIFYWKWIESKKRCLYPFHKPQSFAEKLLCENDSRRTLIVFQKKNKNKRETLEENETNRWDFIFSKTPHYFCLNCRNVLQCAHCVNKKDYAFTTLKDLEYMEKKGNLIGKNRFKKHPKNVYLFCYVCKTENVAKRYLPFVVQNKFVTES
jgi:hypothetical protein